MEEGLLTFLKELYDVNKKFHKHMSFATVKRVLTAHEILKDTV